MLEEVQASCSQRRTAASCEQCGTTRDQVQQEKQRVEEEQAAQALARQQETEMLDLKKRFELEYPEMEKYLVGFTTNGYRQFVG